MRKIILVVLLFSVEFLNAQNYFQDTQGKLDVSNSGSAVYTMPIAMPPSIQDVGPIINLNYASGQTSGIAGQGWSINSISTISRIATRRDIDGFIDGVDFDNNDMLAYEGQRLILKTGTYWADGSSYHTEIQSNTKIELFGSGSSIYFIVTAPDGSRSWYGNYGGMNATDYTAYYITRFEDANGNYFTYHYFKPYNKSLCINEIKFSATISGILPQNSIKFSYELAKRTENAFIKGFKQEKVVILKRIEVFTNTLLFRKYELTHIVDAQLGYEKISKIQEFNGALEMANPVLFDYPNTISDNVNSQITKTYNNNIDFQDVELSGDFDGDGRLDFTTNNQMFTKQFEGNSGNLPISFPANLLTGDKKFRFTGTTIFNNKLNQFQSIIKAEPLSNGFTFKVFSYNGYSITQSYSKTINLGFPATVLGRSYEESTILEGDYNGDGISEVLIVSTPNPKPPLSPDDPCHFYGTCDIYEWYNPDNYHILDLNPNSSTFVGNAGLVKIDILGGISGKDIVNDFNGDGKSDILSINLLGNYVIYSFKQLSIAPWVQVETIGNGIIAGYSTEKQLLFGDYNGDGKTDFMLPDTEGGEGHTLWHIYYSNPNPAGGNFFTIEDHNIVEYRPNTNGDYETQVHLSNYYALDVNKDGKNDMVRVWRKKYKPDWTIGNHDTQWKVTTYINNIGKTDVGINKFTLDYTSPCVTYPIIGQDCANTNDSPDLPIPLASNYRYNGMNRELLMIRNHTNAITYVNFNKDVSTNMLLTKVTSSGGNIVDNIDYNYLEPVTPGSNGLGSMGEFYSSGDAVQYPLVEIKRLPSMRTVKKLTNLAMGVVKYQDFRYHGLVTNMNGIGTIGFRKTARSTWYQIESAKRIWSVSEINPLWRGSTQRSYTQLVINGSSFSFVNSGVPTGIINSTTNLFDFNTTNSVFNIFLNTQTFQDYLTNVKNETTYTYLTPYFLQGTVVSKNYLSTTLQGTTTTVSEYDHNPTGLGNAYYIGRPKKISATVTAYGTSFSTEDKFTYTGNKLTKTEKKANNTDGVYLTEDFEYFPNGNLKKKTLSAPGATPALSPRVSELTYDTSERFIKTSKDIEGLVSTNISYHPVYGVVLSESNPYGLTTLSEYDNWGKRTKITDYLGKSKNFIYTKLGTLYTTLQEGYDGSSTKVESDALGRVIKKGSTNITGNFTFKEIEYDFLNREKKQSEPYFTGSSPTQWTTITYDDYNRVIQTVAPTGQTSTAVYTELTVTTNDGTKLTTATKNANGHVINTSDPGGTITNTYFANGNLKTSTFDGTTLSMEYDGWGRKTKLTDPSAGIYQYEYNAYGETTKEITPKGSTKYTLNAVGKPIHKHILGDLTNFETDYIYDPITKLLFYADSSNNLVGETYTTMYWYDTQKRLITTTETNPQSSFEKRFEYDDYGRVSKEYYLATNIADGKTSSKWIRNTYKNGFHYQIIDDVTNAILRQVDVVNVRGQLTSAKYANTVGLETNTYDAFGFPLSYNFRTFSGANASPFPFLRLTTSFNASRGLLNTRTNSMFVTTENYLYDTLDRLTSFTNAQGQTEVQGYDNKGRITQNNTGTYSYNSNKQYQTTKIALSTTALPYYSSRPIQDVSYNAFKSPVSIKEEGKENIDFEYNTFDTRSAMYYGGLQTDKNLRPLRKFYSSDGVMEIKYNRVTNAVEFTTYIGGDGYTAPIILKSDGTTQNYFYLHRDYLGSILAISNTLGQVVEKRHFDAWGNLVYLKDGNNNTLTSFVLLDRGYTGHEHLLSVGLINMNGRLYDPIVHRFLQPDNFIQDPSNTQNFNRYGYVLNNPLKYTDPSGEAILLGTAMLIGAGIAALTYTITALTTDMPFSWGGLLQSAAIGAFSSAVTFGIGGYCQAIGNFYLRATTQAIMHGSFQGMMTGVQGGDFFVGFASGCLASIASSAFAGGSSFDKAGNAISGSGFAGAGSFASSGAGMIAFGTISGGAGASLTGGNFWQGAVTGLVVSGLNHYAHKIGQEKVDSEVNVLGDTEGAQGGGHLGMLAGNDKKGWTYVSKEGRLTVNGNQDGTLLTGGKSEVTKTTYTSKAAALSANPRYDKVATYKTTYSNAMRAINATYSEARTNFNVFFSNCGQSVGAGLRAAGLYDGSSWVPNERFQQITDYMNTGMPHYMWIK